MFKSGTTCNKKVYSVPYTFKFMVQLVSAYKTVLQTSVTYGQIPKVANYFTKGCCCIASYRLITTQFKVKMRTFPLS